RRPPGGASLDLRLGFGQFAGTRHAPVTAQHGDHPLALAQRRLDLDAYEIVGVVEPPVSLMIEGIEPARADHRQERIALPDLLFEHVDEIEPGRDIVDIHEQLLGAESLLQPVEQPTRVARIVTAAIIDENPARHGPRTARQERRSLARIAPDRNAVHGTQLEPVEPTPNMGASERSGRGLYGEGDISDAAGRRRP